MALLFSEIMFILILTLVLVMLVREESRIKKSKIPRARIKEYWSGEERRQATRINTTFLVKYTFSKKQTVTLDGHTKDVSTSGMRLLIHEKLNQGTVLLLEFDLPGITSIVKAEGKVVWSSGDFEDRDDEGKRIFQAGIQFTHISENDRNRLSDYVTKAKT
ncbi:MAG: PilZ domain-containing protein [Candidatus Omnitrophica bacterium]|nr:PilZ domain-containing protein [Candidatus Omnitrophota bacterium]